MDRKLLKRVPVAGVALLVALSLVAIDAAAGPVAAPARACKGIHASGLNGTIPVHVYGPVSCATGRSIMRTIYNEAGQNHTVRGWRCVGPSAGGAICRKGQAKIVGG